MKITDIKQQLKNQSRYSVYVDGRYACSFSDSELLKLGLHTGQELSDSELERLKRDSKSDKAYMSVLSLIARRPRSESEIKNYLARKQYDQEVSRQILSRLAELGYINDLDFARRWIDSRKLLKPTSKRKLVQELKQKGVKDDVIEQALYEEPVDDLTALKQLIERKRKQPKYRDELKLKQYLYRQGFNYQDIKQALTM